MVVCFKPISPTIFIYIPGYINTTVVQIGGRRVPAANGAFGYTCCHDPPVCVFGDSGVTRQRQRHGGPRWRRARLVSHRRPRRRNVTQAGRTLLRLIRTMRADHVAMAAGLWLLATLLPTPVRCSRSHGQRLELLRFALHRDLEWKAVLRQLIKPAVRLPCCEPGVPIEPLPLVQETVGRFAWLGSRVECAVRVMGQAFACVVYEHLWHVTEIIDGLQTQAGADTARMYPDAYRQAWYAAVMLVDKMAAADGGTGRLNALADLSVASIRALADGAGERPPTDEVRLMHRRIDRFVGERCVRPDRLDVYRALGFAKVHGHPLGEDATAEKISTAVALVVEGLYAFYDRLRIESMPVEAWALVFDYHVPIALGVPVGASFDTEDDAGIGTGRHCRPRDAATVEDIGASSTGDETVTGDSTHEIGCDCQVCSAEIVEDTVTEGGGGANGTVCSDRGYDTATVDDASTGTDDTFTGNTTNQDGTGDVVHSVPT